MKKNLFHMLSLIALVALVFTLGNCGGGKSVKTAKHHDPAFTGQSFSGQSSWYGGRFHGRRTASGERFNMYSMTAAHRSLPFGTLLQVTNLENNKKVIVKVNDRGPFARHRVLDLSYGAAQKLGFVNLGMTQIKARVIKEGSLAAK